MQLEKSTEEALNTETCKNYPFDQLTHGYSFFVPIDTVKEASLRSLVSTMSNKFGKNFKCFKDTIPGFFEITTTGSKKNIDFQIFDASPKAKELSAYEVEGKRVLPFDELEENQCFLLPIVATNEKSIRVTCSKKSKDLKKKFVCVKHEAEGVLEIARIAVHNIKFYTVSPEAAAKGNVSEPSNN